MGYQALLFCPDEKTARTVTQVLNELEFNVESCNEPFAAVKKLMGQHFDAVVVDCDNEQNATLLFKSARNSTSNQTSLAVAVVEGQAGVAKAFRIGANLVLTKPINIEQAKGTVRVARGLLRKSDPTKSGVSPVISAASTPAAPKPAPAKPVPPLRPATAVPPVASTPKPVDIPAPKPPAAPAWPAAPAASAAPQDDELLDIDAIEAPKPTPTPAAVVKPVDIVASIPEPKKPSLAVAPPISEPSHQAQKSVATSGAASAAAPARSIEPPVFEKPEEKAPAIVISKPEENSPAQSEGIVGSAPSFSFGGASEEEESKGGSKKILLGLVAAIVLAALAYTGYSHFQGKSSTAATPATTGQAVPARDAAPVSSQPSPTAAAPTTIPAQKPPAAAVPSTNSSATKEDSYESDVTVRLTPPATKSGATSPVTTKASSAPAEEPTETPLVVKGGSAPAAHAKSAAVDAPAPSLIGMAAPGTATPPPNFVPSSNSGIKPMLQTLNISQGVSQGLLIKKIAPSYPASALRMRIEGTVQLLATLSKDGDITHIKVLSGDSQLAKSASDAVKQWKYKPYLLNGEPVEIQTQVTINFRLPK